MKYFKVTIKTQETQESGVYAVVKMNYLVNALSYTEAEIRVCTMIEKGEINLQTQEFTVTTITKTNITEFVKPDISYGGDEIHFTVKTAFVLQDEGSGRFKRHYNNSIVSAKDIKHCLDKIRQLLDGTQGEVVAIAESNILEVFDN
jgi:glutaredoxin 2